MKRVCLFVFATILLGGAPAEAEGQFADPCRTVCALTLALDSYVVATGTAAVVGRSRGGFSTPRQGIVAWSSGFVVSAGAGMALHGNGNRQRRAVYGGALGAVGGGLLGFALESTLGESTPATRLSAAMIGAALGVVAGGTIGALTVDGVAPTAPMTPRATLFTVSLPH